ncbi:vacuolar protein sorting-associated protein 51, putative [Plasmodium sp. DRC-Itaito]|nr:vacuolar protein sorting-associated protein 51, putative [Plasmodium sp. DRC-Itaito]
MENKSNRRKNVGSMLYDYYNIETRNKVDEFEECSDNNMKNINNINSINSINIINNLNNISIVNNSIDDNNLFFDKTDEKNENLKEKSTILKRSDNDNINLRSDRNYKNINNDIKESNEKNEMNKINCINEFDMDCSNFNVNDYFKELLEKSSMYDLINKSRKIDKEIKQNDSCMQTLIYENYNKFINAADSLVLLKEKFKCVKNKMNEINNDLEYIDKQSNFLNNDVFKNYEKIQNLIEIKKLLNDINEIMKIPEYMYSNILQKKYIKSLKMFIKVIPFFHKNKDLVIFQNLYLDCNNLASIACHFFLKKLNKEKNLKKLPMRINQSGTTMGDNKSDTTMGDNKCDTTMGDIKGDIKYDNICVNHLTHNKNYDDKSDECFYFFDNKNLEESFKSLHSYVLTSEEVAECLNLVLSYGMDRKEIKKLYLKNRINCLKYIMYHIFNLKNHGFFVMQVDDLKSSFFDPNYEEISIDKQNKKNGPKKNEDNKNNHNKEYIFFNNIFENIFILSYKHLLYFFFSFLENYEKIFMKKNNFLNNNDENKSYSKSFFYDERDYIDDKNLHNNIEYLRYLIDNLDESVRYKNGNKRCEDFFMSYDNINNDDNINNIYHDKYSYLHNSFDLNKKILLLNDLFNIDDDKKIIEVLLDIFFKVLCKITIDYIYMFNPPIKLIVKLLKIFIHNINIHNNKIYYKDKILYYMNRFIKKIYYVLLKLYFYNLCFHINIYLYTYFQTCNKKKLIDILESRNELAHYIILKLCLTVMDFEPFYVQIKLDNNFYVKHFFNFVIIYLESLSKHIDSFIYYFVCVHEKGSILKHIKDEEKKENNKGDNNSNPDGNNNNNNNNINNIDSNNMDSPNICHNHFDKNLSKDLFYFTYESADNIIYEDKENIFTHKNLYYILDEENNIHCKHTKKKDDRFCEDYKKLKNYLYSSACVDNIHMQHILVNIKKYMKMEYTKFMKHITGSLKFGKIKKIKETYFLLCLVWVFHNIKKDGVSKIFNVITDMYKETNDLINGCERIDMGCSLDSLLHKDIYPFIKEKEIENKNIKKLKLNDDDCDNYDQSVEYTNDDHIFINKSNEESEDKEKKDLTFTYNEKQKENKLYDFCFDDNNICDNYSHQGDTTNTIIKITKVEQDKKQNNNDENRKKKYVIGISNFVKYKFNEKCNELTNVFISYYINKISYHIKSYIEKDTYEEDTKSNIVSYNFVYCMKRIDMFYTYLKYFIYQNKVPSVINFEEGQEREYAFSDMYEKIEEELEKLGKKYIKDKIIVDKNDTVVDKNDTVVDKNDTVVDKNDTVVDKNGNVVDKNDNMVYKNDNVVDKNDKVVNNNDNAVNNNDNVVNNNDNVVNNNDNVVNNNDNMVDKNDNMVDKNKNIIRKEYIIDDKKHNEDNKISNIDSKEQNMENDNLIFDMNKDEKNLEMYMYKLYMLKMKNYRKKLPSEINKILLLIIKILFKNYMEYIRKCHMNAKKLYKMQIDFFFFYHCLKHYIPCDDENVLFVILNEVLINAKGRIRGIQNKRDEDDCASSYQGYLLLDDIHVDLEENKLFILKMFKE